jgi:putative restriction endonuclease
MKPGAGRGSGSLQHPPQVDQVHREVKVLNPRGEWSDDALNQRPVRTGKSYDTESAEGRSIWNSVQLAVAALRRLPEPSLFEETAHNHRFGSEYLTRGRLGQGAFRVLVTDAYERRCAVTGEKTLPVLEAAHIKPYALNGPHRVSNGILLRSDLHKLFDLGYLTITPDLRLPVSPRLKAEWQNGR